jgi:tetratricopeptide (TPR) repeat protein
LRSLRRFPEAEQAIREALTQLPQNVRILNEQGYLYAAQQQHEAALKAFEQGLSFDPIDVDAFDGKIKALRSQGKWDEANQSIQAMCDRPGNSPKMLNQCGWLYYSDSPPQYDKAIQAFEQTLKGSPDDEDAWAGKIGCLRYLRRFPEAEQVIQEALSRLPRNVSILNQQGYLHADQQQHDKAIQAFEQTLEDSPDDEYAWKGKIDSLRSLRRFPEAEQAIQEALTRLPQSVRILNQQGSLHADRQQYEAAIKTFEQGLSIDPINVDAFDGKIKALRSLAKWDAANQAIQEMCDRPGSSPEMLNKCGWLYFDQKQYDKAI